MHLHTSFNRYWHAVAICADDCLRITFASSTCTTRERHVAGVCVCVWVCVCVQTIVWELRSYLGLGRGRHESEQQVCVCCVYV
jgi:hypothetical protein